MSKIEFCNSEHVRKFQKELDEITDSNEFVRFFKKIASEISDYCCEYFLEVCQEKTNDFHCKPWQRAILYSIAYRRQDDYDNPKMWNNFLTDQFEYIAKHGSDITLDEWLLIKRIADEDSDLEILAFAKIKQLC